MLVFGGVLLRTKKSSQFHFTDSTLNYFWTLSDIPDSCQGFTHFLGWCIFNILICYPSLRFLPKKRNLLLGQEFIHTIPPCRGQVAWYEEVRDEQRDLKNEEKLSNHVHMSCVMCILRAYIYTYKCVCMYIYIWSIFMSYSKGWVCA